MGAQGSTSYRDPPPLMTPPHEPPKAVALLHGVEPVDTTEKPQELEKKKVALLLQNIPGSSPTYLKAV